MKRARAIVTLTLGARHREPWRARCRVNWQRYAERHGFDVICLEQPLDRSERARRRNPAWQKCLILEQPFAAGYEQVVWVDADVLMNPNAPSIVEGVPLDRVGAVDEFASPTRADHADALQKLYRHWERLGVEFVRNHTPAEYYEAYGLPPRFDAVVQTGVMVLSPQHHTELLREVYDAYEERPGPMEGEMRSVSYELLAADRVTWIDPRFNVTWNTYKALHFPFLLNAPDHPRAGEAATAALHDAYFLHFSRGGEEMALASDDPPATPLRRKSSSSTTTAGTHPPVRAPVLLFTYARPDTTRLVLDAIRRVRPRKLLVVSNAAPVDGEEDTKERVAATRELVSEVDWDCDVVSELAGEHLGLNERIVSGLNWALEQVEEVIVLEDDCLPDASFFRFCDELLERYRDEPRVMSISGDDFISDPGARPDRYRCSRYSLTWGWATWRRAWALHDPAMTRWPELRDSGWLEERFADQHAIAYWSHIFEQAYLGRTGWDYAWTLSSWLHEGLALHPEVNLVTNVGFRADATHTSAPESVFASLPREQARFPLVHPSELMPDETADRLLEQTVFSGNLQQLFRRIRRGREIARSRGLL